jgi:hypothetical protein
VQRLGGTARILLRSMDFRRLVAGELLDLLRFQVLGDEQWLLRSCCLGMAPEALTQGVVDLGEMPTDREINYTVEYLHEAILESGRHRPCT